MSKQMGLPPMRMREVVSALCMYALHKAAVLEANSDWQELYPGEADDLRSCAEFSHEEGSMTDETLDIVLKNLLPF